MKIGSDKANERLVRKRFEFDEMNLPEELGALIEEFTKRRPMFRLEVTLL